MGDHNPAAPLTSPSNTQDSPSPSPSKKLINLLRGWPAPSMLPAPLLRAAADHILSDPSIFVPALQYGPDPGYQPLREALGSWLGGTFGVDSNAERICITGGASQSVACVLQSFTDPEYTRAVWAVEPCYYLACPIFEDGGFGGGGTGGKGGEDGKGVKEARLRGVKEDEGGICLRELERGLREFGEGEGEGGEDDGNGEGGYKSPGPLRKLYRHIIYVVATCANPSGKTLSLERREGLVRLARKYNALVVSDDVYDFLQWPVGTSQQQQQGGEGSGKLPGLLPRLSDIDIALGRSRFDPPGQHFGHAISNGSFSKLVGPGIRTGWVHGTEDFAMGLAQTGSTRSGGAPSQFCAAMVTQLLTSGALDEHLAMNTRPALQARHARIVAAVKRELGGFGVEVMESSERGKSVFGGYFVWLTLPEGGPDAGEVAERAKREENLVVAPGKLFEVGGEGAKFGRNIRLCFSWEDVKDIEEGVARLGRVLRSIGDGKKENRAVAIDGDTGAFK